MSGSRQEMKTCLINEVSKSVNLSQKRIREYEKEGFIKPLRDPATNNRLYTDFDILQIKRINQLIHEEGFTLACLRNLLVQAPCWNVFECKDKLDCPAYRNPHTPCYEVRKTADTAFNGACERCAIFINRNVPRIKILEKSQQ